MNDGENERIRLELITLKDSLRQMNLSYRFEKIRPVVIENGTNDDSLSFILYTAVDGMFIAGESTNLKIDINSNQKVILSRNDKKGFYILRYPKLGEGVSDTILLSFNYIDSVTGKGMKFPEEIIINGSR